MIKFYRKRFVRDCVACALAFLLASGGASYAAGHTETTPYNWFFCKTDDHSVPPLGRGLEFTEKYDFYYVDRKVDARHPKIYLTFDVGYENGNVAKILDALRKHNATGAFFILTHVAENERELVERMINEGHTVCNHTAKHPDMSEITDRETFCDQLQMLEKTFVKLYGRPLSHYYRPPEGRFSEQNLRYAKELGYKTVLWSFAYADWDNLRQPSEEKALQNILDHTHNGMILLLHPTSATNAAIMDTLLTRLEEQGYSFGCLDEL